MEVLKMAKKPKILACPNCGGHNIDLWANDKNMDTIYKRSLLNPLKTKKVKVEKKSLFRKAAETSVFGAPLPGGNKKNNEYYCRDCGNRWIGK